MPRPKKTAELKLRKERRDEAGNLTHKATYYIYDDGRQIATGCGPEDAAAAEQALSEYLAQKHSEKVISGKYDLAKGTEVSLADVITKYTAELIWKYDEKPKQRHDFLRRQRNLLNFWGDKVVDDVSVQTCREFTKLHTQSGARRMLEDLRAAVNLMVLHKMLAKNAFNAQWEIPAPQEARQGFFTVEQIAKIIWKAYRKKGSYTRTSKRSKDRIGEKHMTAHKPTRHIARFVLFGVRTGTRTNRMLRASFYPEPGRPYIDLSNVDPETNIGGIFYRAAKGELVPSNKRAEPIAIPRNLTAHLLRWKRMGARYLVEWNGKTVKQTYKAFMAIVKEVLSKEELEDLNQHALRHTAATWLMMAGVSKSEVADFMSMSVKVLDKHYGHLHPDYHGTVSDAHHSGDAGRGRGRGKKATPAKPVPTIDTAKEVRKTLADFAEVVDAPDHVMDIIDETPADQLSALRKKIKKAAISGDWTSFDEQVAA